MKSYPPHLMQKLQQALALHQKNQFGSAKTLYEQVLRIMPNNPDALNLLGALEGQLGDHEKAVHLIGKAIQIAPFANFYNNRGNALNALKRFESAIDDFNRAILIDPDFPDAYYNRGIALHHIGNYKEALADYDRAIQYNPQYVSAYINRGTTLHKLKQTERALENYNRAILLNPASSEAYYNRGTVLYDLNLFEEALASYDKAIAIKADHAESYSNRGIVLQGLQKLDLALTSYQRAIELSPQYADAVLNYAVGLLLAGKLQEGWQKYEARWNMAGRLHFRRNFPQPLWLGEECLDGKTILIYSEQGLGDTLQFCRYIPLLKQKGAKIIFESHAPILTVLATIKGLDGNDQIIERGLTLPSFDFHCPIMSLPLAFQTFSEEAIPKNTPYLFATQEKIDLWQKMLGQKSRSRIGVVWSGGKDLTAAERRNIPFHLMASLQNLPYDFYSLQKGELAEQELLSQKDLYWKNNNLHVLTSALQDFSDTAGFIYHLDLVISVDTAVAHLAGAMRKPIWLLNRFDTCWRWGVHENKNPWYPTLRLFRQEQVGNWTEVMIKVKQTLSESKGIFL